MAAMSAKGNDEILKSKLPEADGNPEERRRILNVLAQRRYRRRKQDRLKALERQVQLEGSSNYGTTGQNTADLTSAISPFQPDRPNMISFNQEVSNSERDRVASSVVVSTSSYPPGVCPQDQDVSSIIDNLGPVTIINNSLVDFSLNLPDLSAATFLESDTAYDFADYAITTPGLSVIRAHTEIVQHMYGPNYQMDIWNPSALSPFCLGVINILGSEVPQHYHPTMLQKSVPHHPVIDMMPWPSFRDRFLYIMSLPKELRPRIAQQDMASVTFELMLAIKDAGGGLRVWNKNPFIVENWEIGQELYSKFWWAIDGEAVRQSNRIRMARGESNLRTDLSNMT